MSACNKFIDDRLLDYVERRLPPEEAKSVKAHLEEWQCRWDQVDNVIRIHGVHPPSMDGHMALYRAVLRDESPLSRTQRELIGVVVSVINGCEY